MEHRSPNLFLTGSGIMTKAPMTRILRNAQNLSVLGVWILFDRQTGVGREFE